MKAQAGTFMGLFLALAGVTGLCAVWSCRHALEHQKFYEIVSGQSARAYEQAFDDHLAFNEAGRKFWGGLLYGLFQDGKPGVVAGKDGWLFTSEEFSFHEDARMQIEQKIKYIAEIHNKLQARHIKLVIVPVPAKARIYTGNFPDYNRPIYMSFLYGLRAQKISVADTLAAMMHDTEGLYFKTDTHWTPKGAHIAAQSVAPFYKGKEKFETVYGAMQSRSGDLTRYMPGAGLSSELYESAVTQSAKKTGLFDDADIPVTLVGTSYSADKEWNFDGFLKQALRADVLNVADEGLGPFATMKKYMASSAYQKTPPKLVVWEIPERYLAMPYDVSAP